MSSYETARVLARDHVIAVVGLDEWAEFSKYRSMCTLDLYYGPLSADTVASEGFDEWQGFEHGTKVLGDTIRRWVNAHRTIGYTLYVCPDDDNVSPFSSDFQDDEMYAHVSVYEIDINKALLGTELYEYV